MIRFLIIPFILLIFTAQNIKYVKTRITDNITVYLPADFKLVSSENLSNRHVSYRSPIAYYTNQMEDVEFSVNYSTTGWNESDLTLLKQIYKSNVVNLFDNVEFIREEVETINKNEHIVFEFVASVQAEDSPIRQRTAVRKYYHLQYTIHEGIVFIFSFNCPVNLQQQWNDVAGEIMHSIKLK